MSISSFKTVNKLIYGCDALKDFKKHVSHLKMLQPLIVTDKGVKESGTLDLVTSQLDGVDYSLYDHVPPEPEVSIIEDCVKQYHDEGHDSFIAVGGGSAMDIAKSASVYASHDGVVSDLFGTDQVTGRSIPLIAIPTTAGTGSEVTNIAILSDKVANTKNAIISDFLLPDLALVAPEMTLSCPRGVTAASGIDALVHAIESYLSNFASPITDALALKAMTMIVNALPKAFCYPADINARANMSIGSLLAGLAFGNAGVGAVHALAYPLGVRYGIPHGMSNALLLPHVMNWNKMACVERFHDIAIAFNEPINRLSDMQIADRVIDRLHRLCKDVEIPAGLSAFNIPESDIPDLAIEASKVERLLRNNPRTLTLNDIQSIYNEAY